MADVKKQYLIAETHIAELVEKAEALKREKRELMKEIEQSERV